MRRSPTSGGGGWRNPGNPATRVAVPFPVWPADPYFPTSFRRNAPTLWPFRLASPRSLSSASWSLPLMIPREDGFEIFIYYANIVLFDPMPFLFLFTYPSIFAVSFRITTFSAFQFSVQIYLAIDWVKFCIYFKIYTVGIIYIYIYIHFIK